MQMKREEKSQERRAHSKGCIHVYKQLQPHLHFTQETFTFRYFLCKNANA